MVQQLYIKDWFGKPLAMNKDLTVHKNGLMHFLLLMARRMNERRAVDGKVSNVLVAEARSNFDSLEIAFGDPDYEWTPNAAFELADDFCQYDD